MAATAAAALLMNGRARYPTLKDRVVLVTGGATGIGRSFVEHFCDQGSRVVFVDVLDDAAGELAESIAARGDPAPTYRRCDVRDVGALKDVIDGAGRDIGPISVLLNNAANDDRHRLEDVTPGYFDERIAVNLKHQLFAAQAVRPQMRDSGGGSIINLNSITWMLGNGDSVCYVAAKAAVTGLTRALAAELGPERIRVNGIAPGWVMTERQVRLWLTPEGERQIEERQALKERLLPPDIARMALWLAADDSRMCTKQTFVVDAGWT